MTPEAINQVIDQHIMMNKRKPCKGGLTVTVANLPQPNQVKWRCDFCGGIWNYTVGQDPPAVAGHLRVPPDYLYDSRFVLQVLVAVAKLPVEFQEVFDLCLFQTVYRGGNPLPQGPKSIVKRVADALKPENVVYACIHTLNRLDEMEQAALARMRGKAV